MKICGQHLQIMSDNSPAMVDLNKQGGTSSAGLQRIAAGIFAWVEETLGSISAHHLKGTQNLLADFLSRVRMDSQNWPLNQVVFREAVEAWGWPEVDLFASNLNKKVARFLSLNSREELR